MKCSRCQEEFSTIFGEDHCLNCCKELRGIPTVRSCRAEIEKLKDSFPRLDISSCPCNCHDVDTRKELNIVEHPTCGDCARELAEEAEGLAGLEIDMLVAEIARLKEAAEYGRTALLRSGYWKDVEQIEAILYGELTK